MILGEVEETITTVEYDEDTYEEHVKVRIPSFQDCQLAVPRPQWLLARAVLPPCGSEPRAFYSDSGRACCCNEPDHLLLQMTKRAVEMLYVRGDGVILVSPPLRTS